MIKQKWYKKHKFLADKYRLAQSREPNTGHERKIAKKVMYQTASIIKPDTNMKNFKSIFL